MRLSIFTLLHYKQKEPIKNVILLHLIGSKIMFITLHFWAAIAAP